jgi:hypothetical protein
MAAIGYFDANTVQPGGAFEVIPAGEYRVMISDSVMEQSKAGGQFLKLTIQVIDGPQAGATLFDRLNLVNANPKAVEIAQRTLSAICHAVGVLQVQDSAQLHNRPLIARVAYKEGGEPDGKGGVYGPSNEIKQYKPITQASPTTPPPMSASAPAPAYQPPFTPPQPQAAQPPAQPPAQAAMPPWMAGKAA